MINTDFRTYNYYTFGEDDKYGMPTLSAEPVGQIKMAIYISSQSIQDNILYRDCSYIGFTHNKKIDDSYVIEYEGKKLKVLYINSKGRIRQIYLKGME